MTTRKLPGSRLIVCLERSRNRPWESSARGIVPRGRTIIRSRSDSLARRGCGAGPSISRSVPNHSRSRCAAEATAFGSPSTIPHGTAGGKRASRRSASSRVAHPTGSFRTMACKAASSEGPTITARPPSRTDRTKARIAIHRSTVCSTAARPGLDKEDTASRMTAQA